MTRHDVTDFMCQHRCQLIVVRQFQKGRRDIDVTTRQREAVDLAALYDMKLVEKIWPQAGLRASLADALRPIESGVGQTKLLRDFTMKLHPQLDFVALVQQTGV